MTTSPLHGDPLRIARQYQAWQVLEAQIDRDRQQHSPSGAGHEEAMLDAIALQRKGMTASSFFEQHHGLMCCMVNQYEQADVTVENRQTFFSDFLGTSESYWQESSACGHPGLDPTEAKLGRRSEISIWIDRLCQWHEGLDEAYREQCRRSFLGTLMQHLYWLAEHHPEQVRPHLQRQHSALLALADTPGTGKTLYWAGYAYEWCRERKQALALYRLAEARLRQDPETRKNLVMVQKGIRHCTQWWRFW